MYNIEYITYKGYIIYRIGISLLLCEREYIIDLSLVIWGM